MRALFLLIALLPYMAFAKTPQEVFTIASKSVVLVELSTINEQFESVITPVGSGVVVGKDGILTNCHVAKADLEGVLKLHQNGVEPVTAQLYARVRGKDLCLLKTNHPIGEPAVLGASSRLKVGAPVYAIGAPQGLELSLSDGVVSQLRGDAKAPLIQTTAPISPGSSGGGLFDAEGRLVGITTFYLEGGQNLNFALPVEWSAELHKPESRILNRVGMECRALIKQKIAQKNKSKSDRDELFQCNDLVDKQMRGALEDVLVVSQSESASTASAGLPDLLMADGNEDFVTYIKVRTVHRLPNGNVQAWVISDYKLPQYNEVEERYYYRSAAALEECDCQRRRRALLSIAHYTEPLGQGVVLRSGSFPPHMVEFTYVLPNSAGESILEAVCRIAG